MYSNVDPYRMMTCNITVGILHKIVPLGFDDCIEEDDVESDEEAKEVIICLLHETTQRQKISNK